MDEKVMEILVQLLQSQTEMKSDIAEIKSNIARMETKLTQKVDALFDGQKVLQEAVAQNTEQLNQLSKTVSQLQLETAHVRLVK